LKKAILVISFSQLHRDPRVYRQVTFLKDSYDICTLGLDSSRIEGVTHFTVQTKLCTKQDKIRKALLLMAHSFDKYYWRTFGMWDCDASVDTRPILQNDFALVIANDIDSLPLALKLARGCPVLFDAHEFAPLEFEDIFLWRLLLMSYKKYLCKRYVPKAAAMTTVCDGIAEEYRRLYGVRPQVITNATEYADCAPSKVLDGRVRMIHHGVALPSRKLEAMFTMMEHLDERYSLDLMLVPAAPLYLAKLKAKGDNRISFVPPVPMKDIPYTINKYDIGLFYLEPVNFNYKHALPNKLFEFVQARLAIAIGPSPEMAAIVKKYDLGIVADTFDPRAMAAKLNRLAKEKIEYYKNQSHRHAKELSADENKKKLLKIVAGLVEGQN
jgi:glycosyltransferase involved in cell wall biosynthesis